MITIEREYSALKGLPFYDLENAVILGQPNFPIEFGQSKVDLTMSTYGVNESQARAVLQAAQGTTRGFSLIQG
jgi:senataxin